MPSAVDKIIWLMRLVDGDSWKELYYYCVCEAACYDLEHDHREVSPPGDKSLKAFEMGTDLLCRIPVVFFLVDRIADTRSVMRFSFGFWRSQAAQVA